MCTAITFSAGDTHYFGRTLDLDHTYEETVTVTPRGFPLRFRNGETRHAHLALIGMATVAAGYPLYYEATNEKGLSMAGLHFPEDAVYHPPIPRADNVAPYELILWVLGQCATLAEARRCLSRVHIAAWPFSGQFPLTPLHWLVADRTGAVAIEPLESGLQRTDDPLGVLTNSPPLPVQLWNFFRYAHLTNESGADALGRGAFALPGDPSSPARFVRAAFTRRYATPGEDEATQIAQFFHILGAVEQVHGCVMTAKNAAHHTVYTSCCDTARGVYYYTTYNNPGITAVDLHRHDLDGQSLTSHSLNTTLRIHYV